MSLTVTVITWSGCFDVDRLETSIKRRGVNDVWIKVPVCFAVNEKRHDDGDDQAHDDGDDDAHVQSDVICAGSSWGGPKHRNDVITVQYVLMYVKTVDCELDVAPGWGLKVHLMLLFVP